MEKIYGTGEAELQQRAMPNGLPAHFDFRSSYFNVKAEQRAALAIGPARSNGTEPEAHAAP